MDGCDSSRIHFKLYHIFIFFLNYGTNANVSYCIRLSSLKSPMQILKTTISVCCKSNQDEGLHQSHKAFLLSIQTINGCWNKQCTQGKPLADILQRAGLQKKVDFGMIVSAITLFSFLSSYVTIIVLDKNACNCRFACLQFWETIESMTLSMWIPHSNKFTFLFI